MGASPKQMHFNKNIFPKNHSSHSITSIALIFYYYLRRTNLKYFFWLKYTWRGVKKSRGGGGNNLKDGGTARAVIFLQQQMLPTLHQNPIYAHETYN